MNTTAVGRTAEAVAATYLMQRGHKILAHNWRTRWCEIDLVTMYADIIHFVEVKYRATARYGGGLDYITPRKRQQMAFGARFWMAARADGLRAASYTTTLSAIEVSGSDFAVTGWIPTIDV